MRNVYGVMRRSSDGVPWAKLAFQVRTSKSPLEESWGNKTRNERTECSTPSFVRLLLYESLIWLYFEGKTSKKSLQFTDGAVAKKELEGRRRLGRRLRKTDESCQYKNATQEASITWIRSTVASITLKSLATSISSLDIFRLRFCFVCTFRRLRVISTRSKQPRHFSNNKESKMQKTPFSGWYIVILRRTNLHEILYNIIKAVL